MKYILLLLLLLLAPCVYADSTVSPEKADASVVEGVFSQVSKLPAAAGNPYPDCYYTATLELHHIVSGRSIPRRIVLVLPGFFSRQYAPEANYKVGDKVRVTVVPFSSMPEKVRQTQQADEVEDVDLEFYYPKETAPIAQFQTVPKPIPFAVKGKKAVTATDKPTDIKAKAARREAMQHDLDEINKLLAEHGGDWDRWYDSTKIYREQYKKQYEAKAQRWVGDSFFSAGSLASDRVYSQDFVKSVIAFKDYLAARDVDLIVIRVPFKGEVADDLFTSLPSGEVSNPYLLRLYKELLEGDVEVIADIIPRAKQARLKYPLMYWYQNFDEPHPAEGIARVVAETVSSRLNRYDRIRNSAKQPLKERQVSAGTNLSPYSHIFFWPEGNTKFDAKKYAEFIAIATENGKSLIPKQGLNSPILVAGSSFIDFPSLVLGSNIPAYLAYLTGIVPDILFRAGSDPSIPRAMAREGDAFLKNRVVCIFPMVPQMSYSVLSSPPLIDPKKLKKVQIASYAGEELRNKVEIPADSWKHIFNYSEEENLTVQPLRKDSRMGGSLRLTLPPQISQFPYFMIQIESRIGDDAIIKATYCAQTDTVYKSSTQTNTEDIFVLKSSHDHVADLDFSNIRANAPTVIKKVTVFGLQP